MKHKILIETDGCPENTLISIDGVPQGRIKEFKISIKADQQLIKMSMMKACSIGKKIKDMIFNFGNVLQV